MSGRNHAKGPMLPSLFFDPEKCLRHLSPVPKRRLPQLWQRKAHLLSNVAEGAPSGPSFDRRHLPRALMQPRRDAVKFKLIPTGRQERPAGWSCELPDEGNGACLSDDTSLPSPSVRERMTMKSLWRDVKERGRRWVIRLF